MCTAISFKTRDHYFGRNLDLEFSYNETVSVTPRNFPFKFRCEGDVSSHPAMIGMAYVQNGYPLYYDCTNEYGLSIAGLNFPGYADYKEIDPEKHNIAPFEMIPWVMCNCKNVSEAKLLLEKTNIAKINFSDDLPASPLHWMISDRDRSIVCESTEEGLKLYDNPFDVMTNNPPFNYHLLNLSNYMNCTREEAVSRFSDRLELKAFSRGMGSFGIPGDLSSASRFVKAAFTLLNSECGEAEEESVPHFMHILGSVYQQKGCCRVGSKFEYTIYSSCCNTDKGVYYYNTYNNPAINAVDMHHENLDGSEVISYPLNDKMSVNFSN